MILYLHGFLSSPDSLKARLLADRMQALGLSAQYISPQLPGSPAEAAGLALDLVRNFPADELAVIGSSLGGYYATWLAEKIGCRAVLLNPVVDPFHVHPSKPVDPSSGIHVREWMLLTQKYESELKALRIERITRPERYFLLAGTADELLDWREMTVHYAGARQRVIEGADHGLSDFSQYMDEVLAFCGVQAGK